uniref:Ig-like domain-containing protein n=1 Tax=Anas platyrhynchos platyrhynchos TaxID=8840 RepID=A0A493TR17_ANAPP
GCQRAEPTSLLLLLIPHARTTEMALLTTDPPWSTIFRGESVTLRCRGSQPSGQQPTTWYHNDKILARTATDTYRITNARQKQTGTYKCQSPGSVATLLARAPRLRSGTNGDPLSIRKAVVLVLGHHELGFGDFWPPYPCTMHLFYRISGRYRCTGQMNSFLSVIKRESQELHVCIRGKKFLGYHVPMVGLADTGSYSCEVRAENSRIWKQSAQVPIA